MALKVALVVLGFYAVLATAGLLYYRYRVRRAEMRHERRMQRDQHDHEVLTREFPDEDRPSDRSPDAERE